MVTWQKDLDILSDCESFQRRCGITIFLLVCPHNLSIRSRRKEWKKSKTFLRKKEINPLRGYPGVAWSGGGPKMILAYLTVSYVFTCTITGIFQPHIKFRRVRHKKLQTLFSFTYMYVPRIAYQRAEFRDGMAHLSSPFKVLITHGNCPLTCLSFPSS